MNAPLHVLDLVAGPDAGRRLHLAPGRHLVGRAAGLSVSLDDPAVEAHHAIVDIAADGEWALIQLAGRRPLDFDHGAGVLEIGCSRIERSTSIDQDGVLDTGWVRLGIGLDPALPDDGSDGLTSFPQMTVIADLGARPTEIVGLIDATGDARRVGARAALRWIVAQLRHRSGWSLVDLLGANTSAQAEMGVHSPAGVRPLVVTDQPGLVRGAGSPIRALTDAGRPVTAIVLTQPGASVLEACTSVLEIGPLWRSRWYPAGDQAAAVRLHATGVSNLTAQRLSADRDGSIVAEQIARTLPEFGGDIVGVPQAA